MWTTFIALVLGAPAPSAPAAPTWREVVWAKSCDALPRAEHCPKEGCPFRDSEGVPFALASDAPQHLFEFEWSFYASALWPAVALSQPKEAAPLATDRSLWTALSGVAADLLPEEPTFKLNPDLVAWALSELLPPPEQSMCGATARALYEAGIQAWVAEALAVHARVKAMLPKRLGRDQTRWKSQLAVPGKTRELCDSLISKGERQVPERALCQLWVRRVFAGDEATLVGALQGVQAHFQPMKRKVDKRLKPVRTFPR